MKGRPIITATRVLALVGAVALIVGLFLSQGLAVAGLALVGIATIVDSGISFAAILRSAEPGHGLAVAIGRLVLLVVIEIVILCALAAAGIWVRLAREAALHGRL